MKIEWNKKAYAVVLAAAAALIGMVVYIVTSVTGYLAASSLNIGPVLATIAAVVLMAAVLLMKDKLPEVGLDVALVLSNVLLLVSFYQFVIARVQLAADVYFIPVNYPASESTALHISIAGVVLYAVAVIAMIVAAFSKKAEEV